MRLSAGRLGLILGWALVCAQATRAAEGYHQISAVKLKDKIRGGLLAQIIGNLNGLPHEMKYIQDPGEVEGYVPSLPQGARTDDDTDLEWMYVTEISRQETPFIPYPRVAELWEKHVNTGIWCANEYARELMKLGLLPPHTGSSQLNPWAEFNLSGQFVCETFGLMSPGMPQTASRLGLHYTHVSIDGEPAQTTQLFDTMIATAFFEEDLNAIIDAGEKAVDPASKVAEVVRKTREICAEHPLDWRAARKAIQQEWQVHGGGVRDWNGYELNTACTLAALLYGGGDLRRTLEIAFNLGWDCDNNAATAATIVGVIRGGAWIDKQGWNLVDRYANTTRAGLPQDETITSFLGKVVKCAELVILQQGEEVELDGETHYRIAGEEPLNVEPLNSLPRVGASLPKLASNGSPATTSDFAREAYLAICNQSAEKLLQEDPKHWEQAIGALRQSVSLRQCVARSPLPGGKRIRDAFVSWGLEAPEARVPRIDEQDWWQIASNPDLGELTSEKQEPVDFGIWQARDGTWQLWSCIRNTKEAGVTRLFHRWEGQQLTDRDWKPLGIAMRGDPKFGERAGGLQAPYVIPFDDRYLMFYGDWDSICLATSRDGKLFERAALNGQGPQLFTEGKENNARDPMLLRIAGIWHCYYSAMPGEQGAIFVRTSSDLEDWSTSEQQRVVFRGSPGSMWFHAECPHVVAHHGYFYLFRTSNYRGNPKTTVYRSLDPTSFGIDDDSKIVAELPVAAPEIIHRDGRYWIAALNPQLDGIRVTTLEFVDGQE